MSGTDGSGVPVSEDLSVIVRFSFFIYYIFAGSFRLYHGTLRLTDTRELQTKREYCKKNEKQGAEDPVKGCITYDVSFAKAVNLTGFIHTPLMMIS